MSKEELHETNIGSVNEPETNVSGSAHKREAELNHLDDSLEPKSDMDSLSNNVPVEENKEEDRGTPDANTDDLLKDKVESNLDEIIAEETKFENEVADAAIDDLKQETEESSQRESMNPPQTSVDEDDEFDDFDEFEAAEPNTNHQANDDFDDFGDFDEFESVEDTQTSTVIDAAFPESCFSDKADFESRLSKLLSKLFNTDETAATATITITPPSDTKEGTQTTEKPAETLLNDRSRTIYKQISTMPYLHPPNWIRSDIRHNLLIKLGIPINLDELNANSVSANATAGNTNPNAINANPNEEHDTNSSNHLSVPPPQQQQQRSRKKSISEQDINWSNFTIPQFDSLQLTNEQLHNILTQTNETISKCEFDLMENTSLKFLTNVKSDDVINDKLKQLQSNYQELLKLSSVWQHQLSEVRKDYEIYEQVVQSCIGYSQKLRREEILENLKKMKKHSSRSSSSTTSSVGASSSSTTKHKKKFWKK
ncbi:hypothetical protein I9W82_004940 [Candida metapsilosis]|uniref:Uncharacterized protein n=1 Tax=Candida metapsilosis TaxID=273372 RepID=A0A8H8D9N1_9ASCO|nr:hypothetical protein I9W82_004940 [Candida metapsilosis]